ncbi:unnamed protein product [Rhizophagus irregularis]|uniref:Uncharacterized protein n=1 Tax=Rhizophagus irregularis TaxID=588596 RepID=A0A915YUA6_9GLOM|nr:unnamed protein product [Rhizophagus irregularis]
MRATSLSRGFLLTDSTTPLLKFSAACSVILYVIFIPSNKYQARIFDRLDEFLHNYPKLPKNSVTESKSSLPLHIGSKVTIKNYNTFLHHYGSSGYKFRFNLNSDNTTGESLVKFFTMCLVELGLKPPDACVLPSVAFVPKPAASTVIPRPPGDKCGNPHARIMCEVAVGQSVGELGRKCLSWMREPYVRAVINIKILEPILNMREPTTGYYYRTMTAKLYRQGMLVQRWDFGNIKKYSGDPITDPPGYNAPNLAAYQITIIGKYLMCNLCIKKSQ